MLRKHYWFSIAFAFCALSAGCSDNGDSVPGGSECTGDECKEPDPQGTDAGVKCGELTCKKSQICVENLRCADVAEPGGECSDEILCQNDYTCNPQTHTCMIAVELNGNCEDPLAYCKAGICADSKCQILSETEALKYTDSNGDTISDYYEIGIDEGYTKSEPRDTDEDGIPDYLSIDANGDTIPNIMKAGTLGNIASLPADTDYNSIPDYLETDSDGNGIPDSVEASHLVDTNGLYYTFKIETDTDAKTQTLSILDANGNVVGTRIDAVSGQVYDENNHPVEGLILHYPDLDGDTTPDFLDIDVDDDGFIDKTEIVGITKNNHPARKCSGDDADENGWCKPGSLEQPWDSDNDTIPDYRDFDSDNDTIPDVIEYMQDTNKDEELDRYVTDVDMDGIPDSEEVFKTPNGYYVLVGPDGQTELVDDNGRTIVETEDHIFLITDSEGNPISVGGGYWLAIDSASSTYYAITNQGAVAKDALGNIILYDKDGLILTDNLGHTLVRAADGNDIYMLDSSYNVMKDAAGNPIIAGKVGDKPIYALHSPMFACDDAACSSKTRCYQSVDCDHDGLTDIQEIWCNGLWSGIYSDVDGDDYMDTAEWAAADYAIKHGLKAHVDNVTGTIGSCQKTERTDYVISSYRDLICNPNLGVENVLDFYFELPSDAEEKNAVLIFKPEVSKLDVVFNMDTTASMGEEIENLKSSIIDKSKGIITSVKSMVDDSMFAVTEFEDFGVKPYGIDTATVTSKADFPYRVVIDTTNSIDGLYNGISGILLSSGGDANEAGFQSLWQIVMDSTSAWPVTSWKNDSGVNESLPYKTPKAGHWGSVNFRNNTLPVVTHITDHPSHNGLSSHTLPGSDTTIASLICSEADATKSYCTDDVAYNSKINNLYYGTDVVWAYQQKGARIITIQSYLSEIPDGEEDDRERLATQMNDLSEATNAIVPVCTFKDGNGNWLCGDNMCCTGLGNTPVAPKDNNCLLHYTINDVGEGLGETLIKGIDALVKYGTYDVAATVSRDETDNRVDTSCFIKKVEAVEYVEPCQEPEASCNPIAVPAMVSGQTTYNDGFTNFAPGTSSRERPGARLHFMVYARNYNDETGEPCVKEIEQVQQFTAYINVINPKTGLVFDKRQVSIIVPGKVDNSSVN